MAKEVGHPFNLFDTKRYDKAFAGLQRAIIGHNRYATQGKVNAANAHPFDFNTIVGAHNGTLTTKYKLVDSVDFDVDSQNLYHHIDKLGLKDALNNMSGAWALTWWDKVAEQMCFLRNKERPLFLTRSKDEKVLFWASEAWMLSVALSRHNIEHGDIFSLAEDMLHTIKINTFGVMEKMHVSPSPATYNPPPSTAPNTGYWKNGVWTPFKNGGNVSPFPVGGAASSVEKPATTPTEKTEATSRKLLTLTRKSNYGGSKKIKLALISEATDCKGGSYYVCSDDDNPGEPVRFYYTKTRDSGLLGSEIIADIGGLNIDKYGSYYKVISTSVSKTATNNTASYRSHKGVMLTFNEWMDQYGECEWCSGSVLPTEDGFGLTTEGQCLCSGCMSDTEARNYVQIVN